MRRFRLKKLKAHNPELKEVLGYTAEGIEFNDGTCVLKWLNELSSIAEIYDDADVIDFVHGHSGKTILEWVDEEEEEEKECEHILIKELAISENPCGWGDSWYCSKCNERFHKIHA